jgi:tripartite-type tricarboxylate transporter receptor subunit TctC
MTKTRTSFLIRAGALAVILAAATGGHDASAQTFPSRPILMVVPYAPGTIDREARVLAELAAKDFGQPVVVENKDGAGGAIGAQFVAKSKADGYTLLYAAPAIITVLPLVGNTPYKYDDLVPMARGTASPHVLAARSDAPFRTAGEMISYAKANPGKVVFGSSGIGTAVHLAGEAFAEAAGIKLNHVPFRGLAPAITAALGGFVDIVVGLPVAINPQVEGGKMRALAQFGATRAPTLRDVPTLKELGVNVTLGVDIGLFAPKGMPANIVAKIDEVFSKAVGSDEFRAFAAKAMTTAGFLDAAEYRKVVEAERALYTKIVPTLGLGDK